MSAIKKSPREKSPRTSPGIAVKSRSRNGCEACKKRRLRCDENHPACSHCSRKGITCRYKFVLQFKDDLDAKGICFGREGVWNKTARTQVNSNDLSLIARSHQYITIRNSADLKFINFFYEDLSLANFILPSLSPSFIPRDIYANGDNYRDNQYLNYALSYYVDHITPILNPIDHSTGLSSLTNDFRFHTGLDISSLIQYGQLHHHIFYLILAVGSFYLSASSKERSQKNYWLRAADEYKKIGLDLLKRQNYTSLTVDSLLSIMFVCLFDLANNCEASWTNQLKAFKGALSSDWTVTDTFEKQILDYIVEFFAYQEAMGRTACKDSNLFDSDYWDDDEKGTTLIPWMGCNKKLVGVISDITDLSFERFNEDMDNGKFVILVNGMRQRLDRIKYSNFVIDDFLVELDDFDMLYLPNDQYTMEEFCFLLLCEIKRECTHIYLECSLLNKTPDDSEVGQIVFRLFKYVKFILIDNNFKWSSLLWPIFIMSSEINPLDANNEILRQLTLTFLEELEPYSLGNINKTREIILNIWKKRDLMIDDVTLKINKSNKKFLGKVNDWETYISNKNYRISLA